VLLTGLGGYRNYYRDALDRLGVTVNVFRVGKYKSFVEPFVNNAPSREAQEAESFWLNDAWTSYTGAGGAGAQAANGRARPDDR